MHMDHYEVEYQRMTDQLTELRESIKNYTKYGQKDILQEELKKAIPSFLCRGLLITTVQEAVNGATV